MELLLMCFVFALPFMYESSKTFRYYLKFFVYYALVMVVAVLLIPILAIRAWDVRNIVAQSLDMALVWLVAAAASLLVSKTCRYFAKFGAYVMAVCFASVALLPVFLTAPFSVLNLEFSSSILKHVTKLLGVQWFLKGGQHLAKQEACVIVANHQSSLDILGMFQIWQVMHKCTVVSKKELFYAWPFGLAAWLCGLIFIDRINSDKARDAVNQAALKIKAENTKLWIFPEGTRRNTGEIHPFKKGAFYVAVKAQLPIQPVVFSRYYFLDDKQQTFESGKIIISALAPVSTEGMTVDNVDDLMTQVRQLMIDEYARISEEVKTLSVFPEQKNFN